MPDNKNGNSGRTFYDLIAEIIRRFQGHSSLYALVVVIIALGGIILLLWSVIYWTAEPGQKISFGFIEYTKKSPPTPDIPIPSLISMNFKVYEFNPRMIDLRNVSTIGIPAKPNKELQFEELLVSVPMTRSPVNNYFVHAEVHVADELIGHTKKKPLIKGKVFELGDVIIDEYHDPQRESWIVKQDWKELLLLLITQDQNNELINSNEITILLNESSTSWLISSPFVKFRSIIYTINNNPPRLLDMRKVLEKGIQAQPGDKLILNEIWYHADVTDNTFKIELEAYLTGNGYDESTRHTSPKNPIHEGIHPFTNFTTLMKWDIPKDKDRLVLWLGRSDGVIVDGLSIPLRKDGNPGIPIP